VTQVVHVAVGVIVAADGKILIAQRPDNVHQGGLWEFPGGKVDAGETVSAALKRELAEELDIIVEQTQPLIEIRHDYGDKVVLLDVHKVTAFFGTAKGNEGQPIRWVPAAELADYRFPAANKPIITAITLADKVLITGEFSSSEDFLARLEKALKSGIKLVQFRAPQLSAMDYRALAEAAKQLCQQHHAKLILNTTVERFEASQFEALHLNRHEIQRYQTRPVSENVLLGASCHNAEEIIQARRIGADYMCLSPVAPTTSHPEATVLGWNKFAELVKQAGTPVFALGGMKISDIDRVKRHGGQGIAAISCFWN